MDYGIVHSKAAKTEIVKVNDDITDYFNRVIIKRYYENGQLKFEGEYNDMPEELRDKPIGYTITCEEPFEFVTKSYTKEGLSKWYHENGQLFKELNYTDGEENGDLVIFHDNGKIMEQGLIVMGKRVGSWEFYDKQGHLYKKRDYDWPNYKEELL